MVSSHAISRALQDAPHISRGRKSAFRQRRFSISQYTQQNETREIHCITDTKHIHIECVRVALAVDVVDGVEKVTQDKCMRAEVRLTDRSTYIYIDKPDGATREGKRRPSESALVYK